MRSTSLFLLLVTLPALAQTPDNDWKAGLASFRARDYSRACPLLLKAAEAAATNGAIWADLGLCELKRGKKEESIHASNLAVRYGDEKVRRSAYFNLGLAGVNLVPQGVARDGGCVPLEPPRELACTRRVTACGHSFAQPGYTYVEGRSSGLLLLPCGEGSCPTQSPYGGHCVGLGDDRCREPSIVLASELTLRGVGSTPAWTCEESGAVESRSLECQSKKGADEKTCSKKACADAVRWQKQARASRAEWKELEEELESWDSLNECKSCAETTTKTQCTVVSIDPCSGRAGTVCTEESISRDTRMGAIGATPPKRLVQEQSFQVAPLPVPDTGQ